jgi:hypothetical protein
VIADLNQTLAGIRHFLVQERPVSVVEGIEREADGSPENESDVWETMDAYLSGILDSMLEAYEMTDSEALEFVFEVAEMLASDDKLPAFPDDNADEASVAEWMGKAKTLGFAQAVLDQAERESEDETEE